MHNLLSRIGRPQERGGSETSCNWLHSMRKVLLCRPLEAVLQQVWCCSKTPGPSYSPGAGWRTW
jgi:hypothetical protein